MTRTLWVGRLVLMVAFSGAAFACIEQTPRRIALVPRDGGPCECQEETDWSCLSSVRLRLFDVERPERVLFDECKALPLGERTLARPGLEGLFSEVELSSAQARDAERLSITVEGFGVSWSESDTDECRGPLGFRARGIIPQDKEEPPRIELEVDCAFQCRRPTCKKDLCWVGSPRELSSLNPLDETSAGGQVVHEEGGDWVYFQSGRFVEGGHHMGRARLLDATTADPESVEQAPIVSLLPGEKRRDATPHARSDGLEMFFASTSPTTSWDVPQLYLVHRKSVEEPWSSPVLVESLNLQQGSRRRIFRGVLLSDHRSLLYTYIERPCGCYGTTEPGVCCNTWKIHLARRATARPGDADFVHVETVALEDWTQYSTGPFTLSCDGHHLLYVRASVNPTVPETEPRAVEIVSADPLRLGDKFPLETLPRGTRALGNLVWEFRDAPNCGGIYYSNERVIRYAERTSCD